MPSSGTVDRNHDLGWSETNKIFLLGCRDRTALRMTVGIYLLKSPTSLPYQSLELILRFLNLLPAQLMLTANVILSRLIHHAIKTFNRPFLAPGSGHSTETFTSDVKSS